MLRVLIVDDSPIIREGLKNIIPWDKMGFVICGEAEDGILKCQISMVSK